MDWNSIGTQIILGIVGVVITGLGSVITYLINKYIKDEKLKNMLLSFNDIIKNCTLEVQQTYVDALKKDGMFNLEAQKEAMELCLKKVKSSLTTDMTNWLITTYQDPDSYLRSKIEAIIGSFKFKK